MGKCLSKATGLPETALGGSTVGATLSRRPVDADISFTDNDFDSSASSNLVLLRALLRSDASVGHGDLDFRLYIFGQGQDNVFEVGRQDATAVQSAGQAEWRVVHAFDQPQHFRLTAVSQLAAAAAHHDLPHGSLGHADFALSELLCSPGQSLILDIDSQGLACEMTAHVEVASGTLLQLDVAAGNLHLSSDNVHGQEGLEVPVLHLARKQEGQQSWSPVLQAQAPVLGQDWRLTVPLMHVWGPGSYRSILWQLRAGSAHLGACQGLLTDLLQAEQRLRLLTPRENGSLEPGKHVTLQVTQTQVRTQPCFLEYLAQGARLCLLFAVDFSGCNPEPSSPACMHHFPQGDATPCEAVMACFADLLMVYCETDCFTLWGFGGSLSSAGCYPLNGNSFLPAIQGVGMLLNTYHQVLGKTVLQGPLELMPVLQGAVQEVQSAREPHNSHHLLIVPISSSPADLAAVQPLLPQLAHFSLSVLLIGIGEGPFEPLQALAEEQLALHPADQVLGFCHFRAQDGLPEDLAAQLLKHLPLRAATCWHRHRAAHHMQRSSLQD